MATREEIQNSNYVITSDSSIREAMEAITYNHRGCVVVVNQDFTLLGVVSDGDLRRAMLKGATDVTPVEKIVNVNPVTIGADRVEFRNNPESFFLDHAGVSVVPVVDGENKIVDLLVKGGFYKNGN